ncbi:hypothetical protein C8R42DRAFT_716553 [Lentinula raphanica]|nr:hypothetical protein C8R42DRAFT_716553 [Lentinula raphanica]
MNNMAARLLEAQRTFQQQLTAFQTSAPTFVTTAPASARVGATLPIGQPSATSVHRPEKPSSALTSSTPRATTSSKPSRASPKSSTATNCNTAKLPRSSTLPPTISYPPSTTLERSPVGKETASARITRVEHNTIRIDQRIDLLLTGLEDRIGQEVDRRVGAAIITVREQLNEDLLRNIAHSNTEIRAHQPSPPPPPSSSSPSSTTRALPPPATLPKRPAYEVTLHSTQHMLSGTTRNRFRPSLGEPHSVIVTQSPECPAFSTTIDFLFDMTRDWSTEVERHTNSYARLPIPSRIMRIDSHHLQLTFNAFGIEAFLSTWNTFHDAIACLSHLSVSRSI